MAINWLSVEIPNTHQKFSKRKTATSSELNSVSLHRHIPLKAVTKFRFSKLQGTWSYWGWELRNTFLIDPLTSGSYTRCASFFITICSQSNSEVFCASKTAIGLLLELL